MSSWACIRIYNLFRVAPPIATSAAARPRGHAIQQVTPLSVALSKERLYVGTRGGDILLWNIEDVVQALLRSDRISKGWRMGCLGLEQGEASHGREVERSGVAMTMPLGSYTSFEHFASTTKSMIEQELEQSLSDFINIKTVSPYEKFSSQKRSLDQQQSGLQGGLLQGSEIFGEEFREPRSRSEARSRAGR